MPYSLKVRPRGDKQTNKYIYGNVNVPNWERDSKRAIDTDNKNLGIPEVNLTICRYPHLIEVNTDRKIIPKPISELNKINVIIMCLCHSGNTVLNIIPSR